MAIVICIQHDSMLVMLTGCTESTLPADADTISDATALEVIHVPALGLSPTKTIAIRVVPCRTLALPLRAHAHAHTHRASRCWCSFGPHAHLDIPRLVLKLLLYTQRLTDEECASAFQCVGRCGLVVCLNPDFNLVFERVGDFVACKEDCGVEQELSGGQSSVATRGK